LFDMTESFDGGPLDCGISLIYLEQVEQTLIRWLIHKFLRGVDRLSGLQARYGGTESGAGGRRLTI